MQEAAYPAEQARQGADRSDYDASGLVAPQFAERADERIKFGESESRSPLGGTSAKSRLLP